MTATDTETATKQINAYNADGEKCIVFVYDNWYAIKGSTKVTQIHDTDELVEGACLDIMFGDDKDRFTSSTEIDSLATLEMEIINHEDA